MILAGKRLGIPLILGILVLAIWFATKTRPTAIDSDSVLKNKSVVRGPLLEPDFERERVISDAAGHRVILTQWDGLMRWLRSDPSPSLEEIHERLIATRIAWAGLDPHVLATAIKSLLQSGDDEVTGMDFIVGNHGFLDGWPTMRVFLLDVLVAADPEMAPTIVRPILDATHSVDEFAVGLRSLTREGIGRTTDDELLDRFDQLLNRDEWQQSRAFAETFDLARYVGSENVVKRLAEWDGSAALKSMAMHEFAADHPAVMFGVLNESVASGEALATLMARADPSDVNQIAVVDRYLRGSDLSVEEAAVFLKVFPLRSATTGFRLYGETPAPYDFEQVTAGDRAAYQKVSEWVLDPELQPYRKELEALQKRLAKWTEQVE